MDRFTWCVGAIVAAGLTASGAAQNGGVGACCTPMKGGVECTVVPADECIASGGAYQGDGTTCDETACDCPPVEIVFVMDTSGSMDDEAAALCTAIGTVEFDLNSLGIDATSFIYGVTETPGGAFSCLTDNVLNLFGADVPGDGACGPLDDSESWGPGAAIVAEEFPWTEGALRVIVPISDEGPCRGSCSSDLEGSQASIANAIVVANANNVICSTIVGTDPETCVVPLATELALGTGGTVFSSTDPDLDLASALVDLVLAACFGGAGLDCNLNGVPDVIETAPLYEIDPSVEPSRNCHEAPFIAPWIWYDGTTYRGGTPTFLGKFNPFFCGLFFGVHDVYYKYIPCWDGLTFISVEGPPTNYVYGVYDDCPPSPESLIDCNEIDHFEVIFEAEKGKTYWIRIAAQYFGTGKFRMYMVGPDAMQNPVDCNTNLIPDECECLADVNNDGVVDRVDFALVLSVMGTSCDGCPEDVDGSGVVDETDARLVILNMGPCPFSVG